MAQSIPEETLKKIRRVGRFLNGLERISPRLAGRLGFQVFCTPRRLPLREKDAETLKKAEKGYMVHEGIRIATYQWKPKIDGNRTALLLHGWESNSGRWKQYIKGLNEIGYTVQAFDAPASGNSGGKMLNALLFSRVLNAFVKQNGAPDLMVGHSLGGAAAVMGTTLMNTPRPAGMVLMGVFAESTRVIRDFGELLGSNERVIKAIFQLVERRSGIPIEAYSVAEKTRELHNVRGLVIHDEDDEVAPVTEGKAIASAWAAPLLQTKGFGHRLQDPSVVQAVVEFAREML